MSACCFSSVPMDANRPLLGEGEVEVKVYPRRWLALGVFVLHEFVIHMMWITFSPISTIAACYYDISLFWINSLSWISMATCLVFSALPATWFLERYGLRATAIVGGCLSTIGAWVRFAGSGHSSFGILVTGQIVALTPYLLEMNACSKLSSVWFRPNQRTFATTMFSVISSQVGLLFGVSVTPLVVTGGPNLLTVCNTSSDIGKNEKYEWLNSTNNQFFAYLLAQAIMVSLVLLVTFFIPEAPPAPPSSSTRDKKSVSFRESLKLIFRNPYFIVFVFVYGATVAVGGAYLTVFQQVLYHAGYSHYQNVIGYLGAAMSVSSIIGLLATSRWIDYSRSYYCTSLFACFLAVAFTAVLSVLIQLNQMFYEVFIAATLTGGSLSLFGAIGLEYVVEMTYPLSEGVSASILNAVSLIFSISMVIGVGKLVELHLATYGMYVFSAMLVIPAVIMIFIKPTLRRREVDNNHNSQAAVQ